MKIYGTNACFSIVDLRSRSQILFLDKLCHGSSTFICELILIKLHTNVNYDNISDKFTFQLCMSKVKVRIAYGRGIHHLFTDCLVY